MPYRLLSPANPVPGKKYPLVLFFHGAGDRGNDNLAQLKHCLWAFIEPVRRAQYPCFVLAPQCPENKQWANYHIMNYLDVKDSPAEPSNEMRLAMEILDQVETTNADLIDLNRIYVSGLSMGGYGTWDCLARWPEKFAAAVPICGGGDEKTISAKAAQIPLWAFHSSDDPWVDVSGSRTMVSALRRAGGNPRYTEYDCYGHECWEPAYADPELFPWLFSQCRTQRG
jgi:predicted peptidase